MTSIWAALLLVVMIGTLLTESFHLHPDTQRSRRESFKKEHGSTATHLKQGKVECRFCDYLKQLSQVYDLTIPTEWFLPAASPVTNVTAYVIKHLVSYIQAAVNKGPPSIKA